MGEAPECTLDDGAGRHIKLRPDPISLVHIKTQQSLLVKTFAHEHSFICFYECSMLFCCITEILSANNIDFSSNQLANVYIFFYL